ncbi:MAG: hypothetical protein CL916_07270 [Deltaproteobacteria bacterium]|nr:hypothetical protein [Deltaproteobacteria bacterium]
MNRFSLFFFMIGCVEKASDTGQRDPETVPVEQPANEPEVAEPTIEPSQPTSEPEASEPTSEPAAQPTSEPESSEPTSEPSSQPATEPTSEPTSEPSSSPTTCTLNDLEWMIEMRGSNGAATSFTTTENLVLAGVVRNPCTEDFTFSTNTTCLLAQALIQGNSGNPDGSFLHIPFCGSAITDWTIEGGGTAEEAVPVGILPADTYTVEIIFADPGVHSASGIFYVTP